MLRFVFLAVLASMLVPSHSFVLGFDSGEDATFKFIQDVCKTACNFESRIFFEDTFPPFICGICRIKGITSSTQPTAKPMKPAIMSSTSGTTASSAMTPNTAPSTVPTTVTTTPPTSASTTATPTTTTSTTTTEGTTTSAL